MSNARAGALAPHYLEAERGWRSWLFTHDHKRIGVMYLVAITAAFAIGGLLAVALRLELYGPGRTVVGPDAYNQMFTLHGAVMIFLFVIPGIPAVLGNFLVPLLLGAKDVAFPRLNLASFHLWLVGSIFFLATLVGGGLDTGWTFYTPYSTTASGGVIAAALGVFILGFSSIFTGLNFLVTIHKLRPPGMTWMRMPLFLWGMYATAVIQVLATPVLGITLLLLIAERLLGIGIFDPAIGGDPVLFQHFFWFYSHPAVYIMILPAMAVISELIAVYSRRRIFGYKLIAYSSIAIAALGFLVWGHHMFVSSQSQLAGILFSALTFAVSIPSGIKVFNWLATLYKGAIRLETPMLYALGFVFLFTVGGLTGMFLGALATDVHLHDTYFVVAHFHYIMVGGTLFAMLGGLHHWWPKMFGRHYSERWARLSFAISFVGFNLAFFPMFVLGSRGMPRRYYDYLPEFTQLHQLSTWGTALLGAGLGLGSLSLLASLWRGRRAADNPNGGATLEWQCASPPPVHNFALQPTAGEPYDFDDMVYDPASGGYRRRVPPTRKRSDRNT